MINREVVAVFDLVASVAKQAPKDERFTVTRPTLDPLDGSILWLYLNFFDHRKIDSACHASCPVELDTNRMKRMSVAALTDYVLKLIAEANKELVVFLDGEDGEVKCATQNIHP